MLFVASKSVKTAAVEEVAADAMAEEAADTEEMVEEAVMVADTVEVVMAEEILAHVMVADTKVTVTILVEAETVEILALQEVIEVRAAILSLKRVAHVKELLNHALLVLHEAMHQEHLALKALQAALLNLHLETLTKKTNTLYSLAQNCASEFS